MTSCNSVYDVAVIGAGIAGLTAAALLQHDGAKVLLCEAHDKPGGCASYFQAGKFQFPVGATVALGLEDGGLHRRVFDYLGTRDYQATLLDGLKVHLPDRELVFWRDADKWRRERRTLPGWGARHERWWTLQETVADAGWQMLSRLPALPIQNFRDVRRDLRLLQPGLLAIAPSLPWTVGQALHLLHINHDRELRALIELLLLITVQQQAARAPLPNGCAGIDLFRHGAYALQGGIGSIARLLLSTFVRDGGTIELATEVRCISPHCTSRGYHDGWTLRTSSGEFRARRVIANMPLANVQQLIELPGRVQRIVGKYEARSGEQWGAVTLYIALREEAVPPDGLLHRQVLSDYGARPGDGRDVFLSLSLRDDHSQAPQGWRALNVSTHTRLSDWENLSPQAYREQKKMWRECMLQGVRQAIPNFDEHRKSVIEGTPKSWRDYTLRARGGVGGVPLSLRNANLWATPQRLGLENFWLVGDSTFPGQGTVACALSGINAWRDITNQSTL